MSHENSITIKDGTQFVNLKTVFNGKQLSREQATQLFHKGQLKPLGGRKFDTLDDAIKAAVTRSQGFEKLLPQKGDGR